jgi:hypothetical protein
MRKLWQRTVQSAWNSYTPPGDIPVLFHIDGIGTSLSTVVARYSWGDNQAGTSNDNIYYTAIPVSSTTRG